VRLIVYLVEGFVWWLIAQDESRVGLDVCGMKRKEKRARRRESERIIYSLAYG
jgi:hypothetical protein